MWLPGDLLTHKFNPDLGVGRVMAVDGRVLTVRFPRTDTELKMTTSADTLVPLVLAPGTRARIDATGEEVIVAEPLRDGAAGYRLADGRNVQRGVLWPLEAAETVVDRLARGHVDDYRDFLNRLDAARLVAMRRTSGLGSFLGGRIRLYPHQLYVAERATALDPVRWLLADEVGLGKTVEACLVLNHLERTGKAERALVVAPTTLTVQWLGELYRKYHQVFVHLDEDRLKDVARDLGEDFNPFDAHPKAVIAIELLVDRPELVRAAHDAGLDLLVVDEAHHLERPPGQPGNARYRAVAPLTQVARHVLLLTATPLAEDVDGFFRLLELLRPEELGGDESFGARIERGVALPPCTSATRRTDIGGFPPRLGMVVDLAASEGLDAWLELEAEVVATEAHDAAAKRRKLERYRRLLSSAPALPPPRDAVHATWHERVERIFAADPRVEWLVREATAWQEAGEKTLVFVAFPETLEALKRVLELRTRRRVAVFHEKLSTARRDIEVAQFRTSAGPSILVSTECGGEGRNFEFCRRIVLFDLPWDPLALEQRVGRLDRIGRSIPIEIVYFRPPRGLGHVLAEVMEASGVFREPLAGLTHELARIESAIEHAALGPDAMELVAERFAPVVDDARAALGRIEAGVHHELHRDPYRAEMAPAILARVPAGLEALTEQVVLDACERYGFDVVAERARATYSIEFGARALVDQVPGVVGGKRFLGTFDREEAVANETVDFFAAGHPLVEGILLELLDGNRGRTAAFTWVRAAAIDSGEPGADDEADGLWGVVAIVDDERAPIRVIDGLGRRRPDWEGALSSGEGQAVRLDRDDLPDAETWADAIRVLTASIGNEHELRALAAVRLVRG
ncbi:MAG: helicase-related protein [bacterium]